MVVVAATVSVSAAVFVFVAVAVVACFLSFVVVFLAAGTPVLVV